MQREMSMTSTAKKNNRFKNKKNSSSNNNKNNQEKDLRQKKKVQSQKPMRVKKRQTKIQVEQVEKTGLSVDEVKKLDNLYLKGLALFGNKKINNTE